MSNRDATLAMDAAGLGRESNPLFFKQLTGWPFVMLTGESMTNAFGQTRLSQPTHRSVPFPANDYRRQDGRQTFADVATHPLNATQRYLEPPRPQSAVRNSLNLPSSISDR